MHFPDGVSDTVDGKMVRLKQKVQERWKTFEDKWAGFDGRTPCGRAPWTLIAPCQLQAALPGPGSRRS